MCAPLPAPLDLSRKINISLNYVPQKHHKSIGCCRQTELCHPSVTVLGLVSTSRDEPGEAWKESSAVPPALFQSMGGGHSSGT